MHKHDSTIYNHVHPITQHWSCKEWTKILKKSTIVIYIYIYINYNNNNNGVYTVVDSYSYTNFHM